AARVRRHARVAIREHTHELSALLRFDHRNEPAIVLPHDARGVIQRAVRIARSGGLHQLFDLHRDLLVARRGPRRARQTCAAAAPNRLGTLAPHQRSMSEPNLSRSPVSSSSPPWHSMLVTTALSESAEAALDAAADLARRASAQVTVLNVLDFSTLGDSWALRE